MGCPGLDQDHIASHQTSGVRTASRICFAPEDHDAITIRGVSKNFMEMNCEPIEVANVQWAEVGVESVVKEGIVNGEIHRSLTPDG